MAGWELYDEWESTNAGWYISVRVKFAAHTQSVMRIWEWGLNEWGIYDLMSGALMSKIGGVKSELLILTNILKKCWSSGSSYPF